MTRMNGELPTTQVTYSTTLTILGRGRVQALLDCVESRYAGLSLNESDLLLSCSIYLPCTSIKNLVKSIRTIKLLQISGEIWLHCNTAISSLTGPVGSFCIRYEVQLDFPGCQLRGHASATAPQGGSKQPKLCATVAQKSCAGSINKVAWCSVKFIRIIFPHFLNATRHQSFAHNRVYRYKRNVSFWTHIFD